MKVPLHGEGPRIDDPVEMLQACHEKVRRFATLAQRLRDHVAAHGADAQARSAAEAVLRYFDIAAVLHHEDEERDFFPALRRAGDAGLARSIDELQAEHDELAQSWQRLRPWLQAVAAGKALPAPAEVDLFAQAYCRHADREESEVYPHAKLLDADRTRAICDAMVARRMPR